MGMPRTTIVGGRPPGQPDKTGKIPVGMEQLVHLAAKNSEMFQEFMDDPIQFAIRLGVALDPCETAILQVIEKEQLRMFVDQVKPKIPERRNFIRRAAGLLGVFTTGLSGAAIGHAANTAAGFIPQAAMNSQKTSHLKLRSAGILPRSLGRPPWLPAATATPTPTDTPTPAGTQPPSSPTPTLTPTSTPTDWPTPTPSPFPSPTGIPTIPPTPTQTGTPTPAGITPTHTPRPPTATRTGTPTPAGITPTYTPRPPTATDTPIAGTQPPASPTPTPSITATPTVVGTQPPSPTWATPTPAGITPTPSPSPSATPTMTDLGVYLEMPSHFFRSGDSCGLKVNIANPGDAMENVPLFVVLQVGNMFYCAPDWEESSYYRIDIPEGWSSLIVIDEFEWPGEVGELDNLFFWGGITSDNFDEALGHVDSWKFGYGE
jgi:hypothetical protein